MTASNESGEFRSFAQRLKNDELVTACLPVGRLDEWMFDELMKSSV